MLCVRCKEILAELPLLGKHQIKQTPSGSSMARILCACCGAMVIPANPEEAILTKLAQLSRFGLGADDRPLLASSRPQSKRSVES